MYQPLRVRIAGTGHALPATELSSRELDQRLGLPTGEIERLSGVVSRRICGAESQIDLAVEAAQAALADAKLEPNDIDLILGASGLPYQALPTTAPLVIRRLGIKEGAAEAHDINATCLSFVSALNVAAARIALGQARRALIVSSEMASRALPWHDQPEVAALFGDGAGAAVLEAAGPGEGVMRAYMMRSFPSGYEASSILAGGTRLDPQGDLDTYRQNAVFRMDGPALFKLTHRHFPRFVSQLLALAGWRQDQVDLVVPHQASPLALDHMVRATGLQPHQVVCIARRLGNQVAASIPIALDIARKAQPLPAGARLLLLGTSAGVSFGGLAIEV